MNPKPRAVRNSSGDIADILRHAGVYELTQLSTLDVLDEVSFRCALGAGKLDPIARETFRSELVQTFRERGIDRPGERANAVMMQARAIAKSVENTNGSTPDERPEIVVDELNEAVDAGIIALSKLDVFQRGGQLVDIVREPEVRDETVSPNGTPRIRSMPLARLKECAQRAARWYAIKRDDSGNSIRKRVAVPRDVIDAVAARGEWSHVRPLGGVVTWPVMRPDGSLFTAAGYDYATGLMSAPNVTVQLVDAPTMADVQSAMAELYELVSDFPFEDDSHLAAWVALLLTVLARPAIAGPVPLGLFDANTRGAGKTFLADLISIVVLGDTLARRTVPDDAAEWRKSMLSIAMAADPIVLFDNVTRLLRSDVLDAVLTGKLFKERALGTNIEPTLPVRTLFLVTSNNATVSTDLVRRSLHVRLVSRHEHPEQRHDFNHADLRGYAAESRPRLLGAALTVLRGYVTAGRPAVELLPMGSFEDWSAAVRAPVVWAGLPDPARTQTGLREMADTEGDALAELLTAWRQHFGDRAVSAAQVIEDMHNDRVPIALRHVLIAACRTDGKLPDSRKLGNALRKVRGQIRGGFVLEAAGPKGEHGIPWSVKPSADS